MNPISYILFDLGNTLMFFEGDFAEVFERALRAVPSHLKAAGLQFSDSDFLDRFRAELEAYYRQRDRDYIEHSTRNILRRLIAKMGLPQPPDEDLEKALSAFYTVTQQHWLIEADALDTLKQLYKKGYRMGIVSNAAHDPDPQKQVTASGLRSYVEFVLTSAGFGLRKPHPRIFSHAIQYWRTSPDRVAMVGDTLSADILGANQAGMTSIWITRRADLFTRPTGPSRPDRVIKTLADLPPLLENSLPSLG